MSDWKSIETAPKDRLIDLWIGDRRVTSCYWDNICSEWRKVEHGGNMVCFRNANYWMPLPEPPK